MYLDFVSFRSTQNVGYNESNLIVRTAMKDNVHPTMQRLYEVAKKKKHLEIAKDLKVGSTTVTNWATRGVSKEAAITAGKVYQCDPNYILTGESSFATPKNDNDNPYNLVKIPILDARATCGPGAYNDDNPEILGFHEFPEEYLRSKGLPVDGDGVYIISSDGDSMAPTIPDKTPLLVNTKEKDFDSLITGKVYVFCANGSVVCKRVFINLDGTIVLRSDNTDKSTYPDQVVNRKVFDDFSVIGRLKTALVDF